MVVFRYPVSVVVTTTLLRSSALTAASAGGGFKQSPCTGIHRNSGVGTGLCQMCAALWMHTWQLLGPAFKQGATGTGLRLMTVRLQILSSLLQASCAGSAPCWPVVCHSCCCQPQRHTHTSSHHPFLCRHSFSYLAEPPSRQRFTLSERHAPRLLRTLSVRGRGFDRVLCTSCCLH